MDTEKSLVGYYSSGEYIVVRGKDQCNDLKLLGNFGNNVENAKRKEGGRRGPLDRQLVESNPDKLQDGEVVLLTLQEAFFLAYALGRLKIISDEDPSRVYSLRDCWTMFRSCHVNSNIRLDFAIDYGVYHFLRSRGWVVKPGDNYGTNYLLYKEGPPIDHSQYAALVINEDASTTYSWESLLTFHRVVQSVGKQLLLINVVMSKAHQPPSFLHPHCIRNMKIYTQVFTAGSSITV